MYMHTTVHCFFMTKLYIESNLQVRIRLKKIWAMKHKRNIKNAIFYVMYMVSICGFRNLVIFPLFYISKASLKQTIYLAI